MEKLNGLIFSKYHPHCAMANGVTAEFLVRIWGKGCVRHRKVWCLSSCLILYPKSFLSQHHCLSLLPSSLLNSGP